MNGAAHIDLIEADREVTIPAAVVLERTVDPAKKWALPHWQAYAVVTGSHIRRHDQQVLIHDDGIRCRYFWSGLTLQLYKDGSEGYWYNLLSDRPYLFVICDGEQGDMAVEPAFLTANQDEATGYMEADRLVLSAPMPADICAVVERYVLAHYQPEQKKKRQRREWAAESDYAKRTSQTR